MNNDDAAKGIIPIDIEKISDDVIKDKAFNDNIPLKEFQKEIKKHVKIKKKLK